MTLPDSRRSRRLKATLRPLPSPTTGLPRCAYHLSDVPCPLPRRTETGACVDTFPVRAAFPVFLAGRHPPLVGFAPLVRIGQHVLAIHLVVQQVEPIVRLLLRFLSFISLTRGLQHWVAQR